MDERKKAWKESSEKKTKDFFKEAIKDPSSFTQIAKTHYPELLNKTLLLKEKMERMDVPIEEYIPICREYMAASASLTVHVAVKQFLK